jgi:hypothetical protein
MPLFTAYNKKSLRHHFVDLVTFRDEYIVLNVPNEIGPMSEEEWHRGVRLIHAVLGLPKDLRAELRQNSHPL